MDSLIPWIGGKKLLRDAIIARFPSGKIGRYIEVFGGAAWILFRCERHADMEVYNDYDGNLVNLFRCAKYHPAELDRELSLLLNSREMFYDFLEWKSCRGTTDIQRAARFFMLVRCSYGADRRSFSCTPKNVIAARSHIDDISKRLARVVIENKDFCALIKSYDRSESLFFCDPPYVGTETYYDGFTTDDHVRLKNVLSGIKGKFILTYNDDPFIRNLYEGYKFDLVERNHNLRARYAAKSRYREIIITNY